MMITICIIVMLVSYASKIIRDY